MSAIETRPITSLRLHPDAEKVPPPDRTDMERLRRSLQDEGQEDPIDITSEGLILDGRTRWTLLTQLGATTILCRVVDIPVGQQTVYIIHRALDRRHLTMAQKKQLNDLMRAQVIEVREPSTTTQQRGRTDPIRIGYSQTERAEKLGVDRLTVARWDEEPVVVADATTSPLPTHAIDGRGRPQPLHKDRTATRKAVVARKAPKPKRLPPTWRRHFTHWCRHVLPEDRKYVQEMSKELHKAMALLDLDCREMIA